MSKWLEKNLLPNPLMSLALALLVLFGCYLGFLVTPFVVASIGLLVPALWNVLSFFFSSYALVFFANWALKGEEKILWLGGALVFLYCILIFACFSYYDPVLPAVFHSKWVIFLMQLSTQIVSVALILFWRFRPNKELSMLFWPVAFIVASITLFLVLFIFQNKGFSPDINHSKGLSFFLFTSIYLFNGVLSAVMGMALALAVLLSIEINRNQLKESIKKSLGVRPSSLLFMIFTFLYFLSLLSLGSFFVLASLSNHHHASLMMIAIYLSWIFYLAGPLCFWLSWYFSRTLRGAKEGNPWFRDFLLFPLWFLVIILAVCTGPILAFIPIILIQKLPPSSS